MTMRLGVLTALCLLMPMQAAAAPIVHVKYPVYGCQRPGAVAAINNEANLRQADPNWLAAARGYGQCVRITPQSPWEPVGADASGLTLLAYRGTVGQPGSFYVPTAAIDFGAAGTPTPGTGAAPAVPPQAGAAAPGPAAATADGDHPAAGEHPPGPTANADPPLAEVEAGMARIDPPAPTANWPVIGGVALAATAGGTWLVAHRRGAAKRALLLAAIRQEVTGNAQALGAKRRETVQRDAYGTVDWSRWHAAKEYYVGTRIDPIVARHGFRRLPARIAGEVDALIETASEAQPDARAFADQANV